MAAPPVDDGREVLAPVGAGSARAVAAGVTERLLRHAGPGNIRAQVEEMRDVGPAAAGRGGTP